MNCLKPLSQKVTPSMFTLSSGFRISCPVGPSITLYSTSRLGKRNGRSRICTLGASGATQPVGRIATSSAPAWTCSTICVPLPSVIAGKIRTCTWPLVRASTSSFHFSAAW